MFILNQFNIRAKVILLKIIYNLLSFVLILIKIET